MNTNRSNLLRMALRTLAISAAPVAVHAQNIISINLGANEGTGSIDTASAITAGALPVAGTFWNNMSGATQVTPQPLNNNAGAASGAAVTWSSANTWRSGSGGGTATSQNGILTKGYLDDGGSGCVVNVTNIPYLSYNVYVIRGSDQGGGTENANANYRPLTINGTNFQGNQPINTVSTSTIVGGASTTGFNWTNDDVLLDGRNFHRAPNQSGLSLVIRGNTGTGRGPIAGVQIEDAYTGSFVYWDTDGATPGAGGAAPSGTWDGTAANWNNAAGTGAGAAWTGTNQTAVFSAGSGATGSYTVNVAGTRTADAVILEEGSLTLTGGTLDLVNAGVMRAFGAGTTLTVNSNLTSAGSVSFDGAGSHVLNGTASHTGGTNISSPFNLSATGKITGTASVNVNNVTAIIDGTLSATGSINLNAASILGEGTIVAGGNVNLNNLGVDNNLSLAGAGSLTTPTGTLAIGRGSVSFNGNAVATLDGLNNPTANTTSTLNINDSAQINVANRMVLGDQTNAVINVNQTGGSVTNTGTINNPGGNNLSNRWGHWGGSTTTYNLSAGSLNLTGAPLYLSWDGPATLNISGTGVANIKGFNMGFGGRTNASTINLNTGGKLNIGSDGIVTGGTANKTINLNGGTLGASASWIGTVPMVVQSNSVIDTTGGGIQLGGALTGTGGLTIQGGGTAVFAGANTYPGATTVTGNSTLLFGPGSASASTVTVNPGSKFGAGLLATPGTGAANNIIAQNGSGSIFRVSSSASDLLDVLDLNIDTAHTLTVAASGEVAANTVFTVIDYATLSGAGYAGINVVSASPRLTVAKEPNNGSTIDVKVLGFDALVWKGNDATNPGLWDINTTQNWRTTFTDVATKFLQNDVIRFDDTASTSNITLVGPVAPASTAFNNPNLNYTLGGTGIGGGGGLLKQGAGSLELGNENTYLGNTIVEAGLLRIGNGTSGSIANGTIQVDGGSVEVKMAAGSAYARPTTLAAGTQLSFTGTGDLNTTATLSGEGNLVVNRAGTVLHNGNGTGLLGAVTVNSGTLAVDGGQNANRFAINKLITVNTGATFEYRGVNATPTAANSIDLVVNSGTLRVVSGTSALANDSHGHMRDITLNGSTMQLNYAGTGTAYNGESIQLNGTFIVGGSAPSIITTGAGGNDGNTGIALIGARLFDIGDVTTSAAPDLIVNAELENHDGGGGSLIKEGAGTMLLNQANSFSGGATVQTGTLLVNGSLATGPVTVASGATLGGSGSIGGLVDVPAGATIAPGGVATGTLTVGGALLGGTYTCDVSGSNADTLAVNGDLDLTGSTLNILAGAPPTLGVYVLATYTGNLIPGSTGTFGAITGLPATYTVVHNPALKRIELTNGTNPYSTWETLNGIAGAGAEADSDNDGIPNGIEFVIGGDPSGPGSDSSALLPTTTTDANYLNFTFRRTDESSPSNPVVQYGSNLAGWSDAVAGLNGVLINVTNDGFGTAVDRVEVKIPRNLAVGSRLFARLKVTIP